MNDEDDEERVYRKINFKEASLRRIHAAQDIIAEYDQKLTVRQLYYQFVSRELAITHQCPALEPSLVPEVGTPIACIPRP